MDLLANPNLFARDINNRNRDVGCIFATAATSVYFKVIYAQLSPVAIFPVLPRATNGLAIHFLGFRQRFGYTCSLLSRGEAVQNSLRFAVVTH
jgi:hypothetical protein